MIATTRTAAITIAAILLLIMSGCSSDPGGSTTGPTSGPSASVAPTTTATTQPGEALPDDVPDEVRAAAESPDPLPLLLTVFPEFAAPGDTVEVAGFDAAAASASLLGPEGPIADAPVTGGTATIRIPPEAGAGAHAIVAAGEAGIRGMAVVTIATGPGVAITVDRGDLVVAATGIPTGATVAVQIGDGFYEAAGDLLIPIGAEPSATLADHLAGPLRFPPAADGAVTLLVLDEATETELRSNTLDLTACDGVATLSGDLGGPGEVRAVWAGAGGGTAAGRTDDGPYRLQTPPGLIAVTEIPLDGEPATRLVEARCGAETSVTAEGPSTFGGFSPEGLGEDEWVGSATGDLETSVEAGIAICSADEDGLEVTLLNDFDLTFGLTATLEGYAGEGTYRASGLVIDGQGGYSGGSFAVQVSRAAEGIVEGRLAGTADGDIGAIGVEAAFRCATEGPLSLEGTPGLFASFRETAGHGTCKLGLVTIPDAGPAVGAAVARSLAAGVPLVEWNTTLDVTGLLSAAAYEQLMGIGEGNGALEAARRAISADYYVTVEILYLERFRPEQRYWAIVKAYDIQSKQVIARFIGKGPDIGSLTELSGFSSVVDKVGSAGICGFVDPEETSLAPAEEREIRFEVVDLTDAPVDGAEVTVADRVDGEFSESCGRFAEESGTTSGGGLLTAAFRAAETVLKDCTEYPRFAATARTSLGEARTRPDRDRVDATVHVGAWWEFRATLTARLPDGTQTWRFGTEENPGFFFVRENALIVGGAPGSFEGTRSCEVTENGTLTYKEPPVSVTGNWSTYLFGRFVNDEYLEFRFEGSDWSSNWPPLPPECAITGMSEVGEAVLTLFAYRPDATTIHPIRLTAEEITVTFSVSPEVLPNAEFTVTIRPVDQDPRG